jgi:hypothetical protein
MNKFIILITFFFVYVFFPIASFLYGINVSDELRKIPEVEQTQLKSLFYKILNQDHGAYTLFGDKPVSISGSVELTPWDNTIEGIPCGGLFWKEWSVWEKHKHLFNPKKYLFFKEQSNNKLVKNSFVFIVKKEEFIKTINKNKRIFEKILDREIVAENILKNIQENKITFLDSIKHNHILLGILLGYGKHNAGLFSRKYRDDFETGISCDLKKNNKIHLKPCGDYHYSPLVIKSTHFVADLKHPETRKIQKNFCELRGKISAVYANGDFLEITLRQLTSD